MSKTDLSEKQSLALLSTIYHEMKILFKELPDSDKIAGCADLKKKILNNFKSLLLKGYTVDLSDKSMFNLFDCKD